MFQMWKLRTLRFGDLCKVGARSTATFQTQAVRSERPGSAGIPNIFKGYSSEPSASCWVDLHDFGFIVAANLVNKHRRNAGVFYNETQNIFHFPSPATSADALQPYISLLSTTGALRRAAGYGAYKWMKTKCSTDTPRLHCVLFYGLQVLRQTCPELRWALVTHSR